MVVERGPEMSRFSHFASFFTEAAAVGSAGSLLLLLFSLCPAARADLPPESAILEVMMSAQEADIVHVQRIFGAAPDTSLTFSSLVDVAAQSFQYSSAPGSTYLGSPFQLTTTGILAGPNTWSWTLSGSLGAQTWTGTGSHVVVGDPESSTVVHFVVAGDPTDYDVGVIKDVTQNADTSTSSVESIWLTIGGSAVSLRWAGRNDTGPIPTPLKPEEPPYSWGMFGVQPTGINIIATGSSAVAPEGISSGSFTITQTAAPEPATLALLGMGLLPVLGAVIRCRLRK
jgi:hypothetical protein